MCKKLISEIDDGHLVLKNMILVGPLVRWSDEFRQDYEKQELLTLHEHLSSAPS
jgi:2,4-dienoyl-CoA reductase-like NADH-dependent reductase (Old Yellow Enzyme family)